MTIDRNQMEWKQLIIKSSSFTSNNRTIKSNFFQYNSQKSNILNFVFRIDPSKLDDNEKKGTNKMMFENGRKLNKTKLFQNKKKLNLYRGQVTNFYFY